MVWFYNTFVVLLLEAHVQPDGILAYTQASRDSHVLTSQQDKTVVGVDYLNAGK